jgi:hypothetical protein
MPPLAPRERPFTKIHSRLSKAELQDLARALRLKVDERATVIRLREITKRRLRSDAYRYISHPDYRRLYTKRDLQDLEHQEDEGPVDWVGLRESIPDESIPHTPIGSRPRAAAPIRNRGAARRKHGHLRTPRRHTRVQAGPSPGTERREMASDVPLKSSGKDIL